MQFLRDNRQVPTRYKNAREFHDPDKQFPALPPQFAEGPDEANPGSPTDDDFSAYKAARAWFTYSCVPLPPNPRDWEGKPMPWRTPYLDEYNQLLYRVPRQPLMIIFRQGPPRVQSFQAEMEQKEGWFDAEGWRIDDPTDQQTQNWWFPDPEHAAGRTAAPPGRRRGAGARLVARGVEPGSRHVAPPPRRIRNGTLRGSPQSLPRGSPPPAA